MNIVGMSFDSNLIRNKIRNSINFLRHKIDCECFKLHGSRELLLLLKPYQCKSLIGIEKNFNL